MAKRGEIPAELVERVLERLREGETLNAICQEPGMPKWPTFHSWVSKDPDLAEKYARARELGYLRMAEQLLEIVDDGRNDWMTITRGGAEIEVVNKEAVERSRLRFQARQWLLSKALPKIYGDKLDISGKVDASDAFVKMWDAIGKGAAKE